MAVAGSLLQEPEPHLRSTLGESGLPSLLMARAGRSSATESKREIHAKLRAHLRANVTVAAIILVASLAMGMIGYHTIAALPWVDAFLNASMLLAGMGPVADLRTDSAKV